MSRLRRLLVTLVIFVLTVAVPPVVDACPYCAKSPNGFGFCRYGAPAGAYWCKDGIVVDTFTGRTTCDVGGECHWRGDRDDGDSCGYTDIYGNCLI